MISEKDTTVVKTFRQMKTNVTQERHTSSLKRPLLFIQFNSSAVRTKGEEATLECWYAAHICNSITVEDTDSNNLHNIRTVLIKYSEKKNVHHSITLICMYIICFNSSIIQIRKFNKILRIIRYCPLMMTTSFKKKALCFSHLKPCNRRVSTQASHDEPLR